MTRILYRVLAGAGILVCAIALCWVIGLVAGFNPEALGLYLTAALSLLVTVAVPIVILAIVAALIARAVTREKP